MINKMRKTLVNECLDMLTKHVCDNPCYSCKYIDCINLLMNEVSRLESIELSLPPMMNLITQQQLLLQQLNNNLQEQRAVLARFDDSSS